MPDEVKAIEYELDGERAAKDEALAPARERWFHAALMPLKVRYLKWGAKVKAGEKKNPPTQVKYEEWLKLPANARGEEVTFDLDPRVVAPTLQYHITRKVLIGFGAWNDLIMPAINDVAGSFAEFAERAKSKSWFVEGVLVPTGRTYTDQRTGEQRPETLPKFTRMTPVMEELLQWNREKYPKAMEEVPQEVLADAKLVWTRMAKGNYDKFVKLLDSNEEFEPYLGKILDEAKGWKE